MNQDYVVKHLDEALEKGWISVFYQPVIRSLSGTLCGQEALARWTDPEGEILPAADFVPALEAAGQIHKLDAYMIYEVCRRYRERVDGGAAVVPVSCNLSGTDFVSMDVLKVAEDAVSLYRVPRNMIRFEVKESLLISDHARVGNRMRELREAGFQIWLDHFGSDFSSLNILKDFDFDVLKMDLSYLLSSFSDRSREVMYSLISLAKKLGIETLAEGCETSEQAAFLRSIGCEKLQGYYFGRPQSDAEAWKTAEAAGILSETEEDVQVYQTAGRIAFCADRGEAILECVGDCFHVLYTNEAFQRVMLSAGMREQEGLHAINDLDGQFYQGFRSHIERALTCMADEHFSFSYQGKYLAMDLSVLAQLSDRLICRIIMRNTNVVMKTGHRMKAP